jgi:hypothetical protein
MGSTLPVLSEEIYAIRPLETLGKVLPDGFTKLTSFRHQLFDGRPAVLPSELFRLRENPTSPLLPSLFVLLVQESHVLILSGNIPRKSQPTHPDCSSAPPSGAGPPTVAVVSGLLSFFLA